MAIAQVQAVAGAASTTTTATVTPGNVTAGNFLVAVVYENQNSSTPGGVTSISNGGATANVTWTLVVHLEDNTVLIAREIWVGYVAGTTSSPPTFTVTYNVNGAVTHALAIGVSEWTGIMSGSATDNTFTSSTGGNTSPVSMGPLAQSVGNELFIEVASSGGTPVGPTGGWTALPGVSGHTDYLAGYLIATDAASHSTTYTFSGTHTWLSIGANFLPQPGVTRRAFGGMTQAVNRSVNYMRDASGLLLPERASERVVVPRLALAR